MYKCWEFHKKYCKRVAPDVQISGQNSKFWQFWGLYSHILPRWTLNLAWSIGPLPHAKFQAKFDAAESFDIFGVTVLLCRRVQKTISSDFSRLTIFLSLKLQRLQFRLVTVG